jgi:hypothetical protein
MRKTLVGVAVAMALVGAARLGEAQDKRLYANYRTYGAGAQSCGQFVEARRDPLRDTDYLHWLGGHMTAMAGVRASLELAPAGTDLQTAAAWLEGYCGQVPLELFSSAAMALHNWLVKEHAVRSAR